MTRWEVQLVKKINTKWYNNSCDKIHLLLKGAVQDDPPCRKKGEGGWPADVGSSRSANISF